MAFQFPWTNFHELNLDWFLSKFKQFTDNFLGTTATAESVPYTDAPSVTVTGGELDDDTDIVDPFTFNFKIPAGQPGEQGEQGVPGVPGQDGFSPIATVTKSGSVATITITDINGTTTTTISDGTVNIDQLNTKAPAIYPTVSGSIANFSDGADNLPMTSLVADIEPVQDLSNGDPSPTNICPITGHTEVNVTRTGKNLLPYTEQGAYKTADGIPILANNYVRSPKIIAKPDVTYWIRASVASVSFLFWDVNGNFISGTDRAGVANRHLTAPSNAHYVAFNFYSNAGNITPETVGNIMVNVGSGFADYEPYTSEAISVSWQDEAGTVYGGTLDVATGVLTVTDGYIASYAGETLPSTWISDRDVYASGTTPTTGAEVVYKLATPLTYQLTPQQLFNTLYGGNNVWNNTGDSTVTYTADTMLYIQNLTQPTEDDMIANNSIASGKYFMIGNNLYKATTAIASGSQIIPGTNATPMSLADALNS